jgi:hypothetical protein
MDYTKKKIVLCSTGSGKHDVFILDTTEQVEAKIKEMHEQTVHPNMTQRLTTMAHVFQEGSAYPTEPQAFWDERRDRNGRVAGYYFMQWKNKNNDRVQKTYDWREDAELRLQTIQDKGFTDVLVLHVDESINGDTYYKQNIAKIWG